MGMQPHALGKVQQRSISLLDLRKKGKKIVLQQRKFNYVWIFHKCRKLRHKLSFDLALYSEFFHTCA